MGIKTSGLAHSNPTWNAYIVTMVSTNSTGIVRRKVTLRCWQVHVRHPVVIICFLPVILNHLLETLPILNLIIFRVSFTLLTPSPRFQIIIKFGHLLAHNQIRVRIFMEVVGLQVLQEFAQTPPPRRVVDDALTLIFAKSRRPATYHLRHP